MWLVLPPLKYVELALSELRREEHLDVQNESGEMLIREQGSG